MGLIRKIREKRDPWSVRLEEPRKETDDSANESEQENVIKKREMFGKFFEKTPANEKNSH